MNGSCSPQQVGRSRRTVAVNPVRVRIHACRELGLFSRRRRTVTCVSLLVAYPYLPDERSEMEHEIRTLKAMLSQAYPALPMPIECHFSMLECCPSLLVAAASATSFCALPGWHLSRKNVPLSACCRAPVRFLREVNPPPPPPLPFVRGVHTLKHSPSPQALNYCFVPSPCLVCWAFSYNSPLWLAVCHMRTTNLHSIGCARPGLARLTEQFALPDSLLVG